MTLKILAVSCPIVGCDWNSFPDLGLGFYVTNIIELHIGEIRDGAERVGFEVVTLDGRRGPLASTKVNRYLCCIYMHINTLCHIFLS